MWDDKEIERGINEVRDALMLDRMPSSTEIKVYYGNSRLVNAITKNGGFRHWAEKLGLEPKDTSTNFGYKHEERVKELLEERGYTCEMTSTKHPYDLLINGCVKADVKTARISKVKDCDRHTFYLAKQQQTCDVYIVVCLDDNDEMKKLYVVPAHVMHGKTQLSPGTKHSKYNQYLNRWDIIDQLSRTFEEIS